jgi:Flp pilus assembly pilin Flp
MVQFIEAWLGLYARQDRDDDAAHAGQGLVEYALLIWFIAIVVFVAIVFLREKIITVYSRIGNSVPN